MITASTGRYICCATQLGQFFTVRVLSHIIVWIASYCLARSCPTSDDVPCRFCWHIRTRCATFAHCNISCFIIVSAPVACIAGTLVPIAMAIVNVRIVLFPVSSSIAWIRCYQAHLKARYTPYTPMSNILCDTLARRTSLIKRAQSFFKV
jgi:hypothetical protein